MRFSDVASLRTFEQSANPRDSMNQSECNLCQARGNARKPSKDSGSVLVFSWLVKKQCFFLIGSKSTWHGFIIKQINRAPQKRKTNKRHNFAFHWRLYSSNKVVTCRWEMLYFLKQKKERKFLIFEINVNLRLCMSFFSWS